SPQNVTFLYLQYTLLQNAVHPIMELRQVRPNVAQLKTFIGQDMNYDKCCSLLLSAAQHYNTQMKRNTHKIVERRVYLHELLDFEKTNNSYAIPNDYHDIDLS